MALSKSGEFPNSHAVWWGQVGSGSALSGLVRFGVLKSGAVP
jgi:hypothetical protein